MKNPGPGRWTWGAQRATGTNFNQCGIIFWTTIHSVCHTYQVGSGPRRGVLNILTPLTASFLSASLVLFAVDSILPQSSGLGTSVYYGRVPHVEQFGWYCVSTFFSVSPMTS